MPLHDLQQLPAAERASWQLLTKQTCWKATAAAAVAKAVAIPADRRLRLAEYRSLLVKFPHSCLTQAAVAKASDQIRLCCSPTEAPMQCIRDVAAVRAQQAEGTYRGFRCFSVVVCFVACVLWPYTHKPVTDRVKACE